jgi:catechol 2,3-dioxygenase-like lactoylglutathione lyase family enzyme
MAAMMNIDLTKVTCDKSKSFPQQEDHAYQRVRRFSFDQLSALHNQTSDSVKLNKHLYWTLSDAASTGDYVMFTPRHHHEKKKLPLASFNHIAREVLSLERSKQFYVDILGFALVPRPPFDSEGYWLYGYGLSLHLVATTVPAERKEIKLTRIRHFSSSLPRVDHIAFITHDIDYVQQTLDDAKVYYLRDTPVGGLEQIFLFDPDGNVIEISNCAPPVGEIRCAEKEPNEFIVEDCNEGCATSTEGPTLDAVITALGKQSWEDDSGSTPDLSAESCSPRLSSIAENSERVSADVSSSGTGTANTDAECLTSRSLYADCLDLDETMTDLLHANTRSPRSASMSSYNGI